MTPEQIETVYETLAETLDAVPADKRELFLAKLALLMSKELGDAEKAAELIAAAALDLDV